MAKASEQFRQSDVTVWGMVALICGAVAVFSANVSAVIPQSVLAGLHKTRLEGASVDQLRMQISDLREQSAQLKRQNATLLTRFSLQEQASNDVIHRVGALEVSLPRLLEALPNTAEIDRSSLTASIDEGETLVFDAEGGTVVVRQQPLQPIVPETSIEQPMPAIVAEVGPAGSVAFGVAIGPKTSVAAAPAAWDELSSKVGTLLVGLALRLVDETNGTQKRILAGPISQLSDATALCARLERVSISCIPMPYGGTPLSF